MKYTANQIVNAVAALEEEEFLLDVDGVEASREALAARLQQEAWEQYFAEMRERYDDMEWED